jgi:hypothetical protein
VCARGLVYSTVQPRREVQLLIELGMFSFSKTVEQAGYKLTYDSKRVNLK